MKFEVKQKDLLAQNYTQYLVDVLEYSKGHLVYKYQDALYSLDINERDLTLVYKTSDSTTTMSSKNKLGQCVVENSVGKLEFELYVLQQRVQEKEISVEYKLFQQGMMVSHFIYEWKGR